VNGLLQFAALPDLSGTRTASKYIVAARAGSWS
jgi:hypothetical protein